MMIDMSHACLHCLKKALSLSVHDRILSTTSATVQVQINSLGYHFYEAALSSLCVQNQR